MKLLLKTEQLAYLITCYAATLYLGYTWWLFLILLLTPDISMVGYLFGNRWGAWCYNLFHHQGAALLVIITGWHFSLPTLLLVGIILLGHSAMDRALGYGLKYSSGFHDTHLGRIGKPNR